MPLSDILNCEESELWEILDSDLSYEHEGWFMSKNVSLIELSMLGEMLDVAPYQELMDQFDLIGEPRDEGPWPQTIPASLVEKLASITDEEIKAVVPTWVGIEEFRGLHTEESLSEYLMEFRNYSKGRTGSFFLILAL